MPATCIYCGRTIDPFEGEGDHIVPAGMGEFTGLRRFRDICVPCNNRIGRSEEQLLRCGPEAYLIRVSDPPRRRDGEDKSWPGAMGAPPPGMLIERGGVKLSVRPVANDPRDVTSSDQLVIETPAGAQFQVPVFPDRMTAPAVRRKIQDTLAVQHISGPVSIRFDVTADSFQWVERVARELWPEQPLVEGTPTEAGNHRTQGLLRFQVTDHYFRALAKMALHYYLAYSGSGERGDEPEFSAIRRFIMEGTEWTQFFTTPRQSPVYFGVPFGDIVGYGGEVSSGQWCHLMAGDNTQGEAVVYLHLFLGPGFCLTPHYVTLGKAAGHRNRRAWASMLTWEPGSRSKCRVERRKIATGARPETMVGPGLETSDMTNPLYAAHRGQVFVTDPRLLSIDPDPEGDDPELGSVSV